MLAVFKSSFGRDQRSVPADRLHTQVETFLDELRANGETVPSRNGRALCVQWMGDQWLYRTVAALDNAVTRRGTVTARSSSCALLTAR
ncbi:DUF3375 family protein [Pseudonocardia sp. TMWB2A]|uniref:DUF3375 family protein n=1 Tax=Pseudonocardia sp. TMWB2A TaxID=687430 RepID=UPI00307F726F